MAEFNADTWERDVAESRDEARMMGASRGAEIVRVNGGPLTGEELPAPLSGEWAGDPTPQSLTDDLLGEWHDLGEVPLDDRIWADTELADAYEEGFFAVVTGEATACGPLTGMNAICREPGTFCAHAMTAR